MKLLVLLVFVAALAGCSTFKQDGTEVEPIPIPIEMVFPPLPGDVFDPINFTGPLPQKKPRIQAAQAKVTVQDDPVDSHVMTLRFSETNVTISIVKPEWNIRHKELAWHENSWKYTNYSSNIVARLVAEDIASVAHNLTRVDTNNLNRTTRKWITRKYFWDMTNQVHVMKYIGYDLDETNSTEVIISLWAQHGWFNIVMPDNGKNTYLTTSDGAEGEGYYLIYLRVDRDHIIHDKILANPDAITTTQSQARDQPPPEYGTWYAMRYYADVFSVVLNRGYFEMPPPEQGFQTEPSVELQTNGMLRVNFTVYDEYDRPVNLSKVTNIDHSDFSIEATTNLVEDNWFHLADGITTTIQPEYDQMFFRLQYSAP